MLGRDKKSPSISAKALGMKTVLHIANTGTRVTRLLEVVPNIEDWLLIYASVGTLNKDKEDNLSLAQNYDDYCKHQVKGRNWRLYDDHTEASILLSACGRQDKCILVPSD